MPPCRRAGAALPGRFAETLDSPPTGQLEKNFAEVVGLDDNLDIFFLGRIPTLGLAGWRLRCRAGSAAGMWRARYRSLHVGVEFVTGHVCFFPTYCGFRFGTSASEKVVCQTYHPLITRITTKATSAMYMFSDMLKLSAYSTCVELVPLEFNVGNPYIPGAFFFRGGKERATTLPPGNLN